MSRRQPLDTAQLPEQRQVRFREPVVHQFVEGDPAQIGDFEFLRFAGKDAGVEEAEPDVAVGIGVDDGWISAPISVSTPSSSASSR